LEVFPVFFAAKFADGPGVEEEERSLLGFQGSPAKAKQIYSNMIIGR
jgi:hypothetical protein